MRVIRTGSPVLKNALVEAIFDATRWREEARAEGFEEGRAEGYAEAAVMLAAAHDARERALADAETGLVQVVRTSVEHLLRERLEQDDALLQRVIAPSLHALRRAQRLRVRVHPGDLGRLELLTQTYPTVTLEADPGLGPGDVVLSSDLGTIDLRIDARLDALTRALSASQGGPHA